MFRIFSGFESLSAGPQVMIDIYSRHRPLALLAGVVFAQTLLLAFQIKRDHDVPLIRYWAAELVTPVGRMGTWSSSKVGGVWSGYIALHGAHGENEQLRNEVNQLRLRNADLETQASEAQRLSALLKFHDDHSEAQMLAAQVIEPAPIPASHTLFVNRGERDHVRRNMAVITPDGIVGKIVEVLSNNTSQVLLINDKESGVGALFSETRTHGVVKGTGDPEPRMDYVVNDEKVHSGEIMITSGEDRIFPKGLLIGTVSGAAPGKSVSGNPRPTCGAAGPAGGCADPEFRSRRSLRKTWKSNLRRTRLLRTLPTLRSVAVRNRLSRASFNRYPRNQSHLYWMPLKAQRTPQRLPPPHLNRPVAPPQLRASKPQNSNPSSTGR